jgi:hypothetical protein
MYVYSVTLYGGWAVPPLSLVHDLPSAAPLEALTE